MGNNHVQVSQGFRILLGAFAPYVTRELETNLEAIGGQTECWISFMMTKSGTCPILAITPSLLALSTFKFVSYSLLMFIDRVYSERSSPSTTVPGQ